MYLSVLSVFHQTNVVNKSSRFVKHYQADRCSRFSPCRRARNFHFRFPRSCCAAIGCQATIKPSGQVQCPQHCVSVICCRDSTKKCTTLPLSTTSPSPPSAGLIWCTSDIRHSHLGKQRRGDGTGDSVLQLPPYESLIKGAGGGT